MSARDVATRGEISPAEETPRGMRHALELVSILNRALDPVALRTVKILIDNLPHVESDAAKQQATILTIMEMLKRSLNPVALAEVKRCISAIARFEDAAEEEQEAIATLVDLGTESNKKKACLKCGETNTPEWRRGPAGAGTLCNACGIAWSRLARRSKIEP